MADGLGIEVPVRQPPPVSVPRRGGKRKRVVVGARSQKLPGGRGRRSGGKRGGSLRDRVASSAKSQRSAFRAARKASSLMWILRLAKKAFKQRKIDGRNHGASGVNSGKGYTGFAGRR